MPAAVVPRQPVMRQPGGERFVKNALEIGDTVVVVIATGIALEETGRRHLLWVTDDDAARAPGYGADCVGHSDLAGLVENDKIEGGDVRWQELCDRQRTHHQARRQGCQCRSHLRHKLAHRHVLLSSNPRARTPKRGSLSPTACRDGTDPESFARMTLTQGGSVRRQGDESLRSKLRGKPSRTGAIPV